MKKDKIAVWCRENGTQKEEDGASDGPRVEQSSNGS